MPGYWAGRAEGPTIEIRQPQKFVGLTGTLEMMVRTPGGLFSGIEATLEQSGKSHPVYALEPQDQKGGEPKKSEELYVSVPIGKRSIPALTSGPARIVVRATRPVLYGLREAESVVSRDVQVRLEPPQVAVLSTFHYVNLGGSEFVVYRASPEDVVSGVRVGDKEYPGYPARGAGITSDPAMRVAFFALLFDQPLDAPMQLFARDVAGNEVVASLDHMVFSKPYQRSRIEIDDRFLQRVVPAIASNSPGEDIPRDDVLAGFLKINGDLRRKNNQYLADLSKKSSPELMSTDAFQQLGNSQIEAKFADTRTYVVNKGKEDRQTSTPWFRPRRDGERSSRGRPTWRGGARVRPRHLRQLRGHRPWDGSAVAVRDIFSAIGVKVGDTIQKGQQIDRAE